MKFSAALCLVVLFLAAYVACSRSSSYIRYEACRQGCSSKTRACIKSCIAKLSDYADDELADSEFDWFGWFDEKEEPKPKPKPTTSTPSSGTTTSTSTTTTTTTVTVNCPPNWPNCKEDLGVKDTKKETTVVVEPPKPKNPHFYSMFFINSVLNSLETNLQFAYGGSILAQASPLLPEFADNVAQFSQYLNSYGRKDGDLDFHQAYAKFIDSLDMPADFNKTIYSNEDLLKIQNDLREARVSLSEEETKCFARYTGMMQNMYTRDAFKQVFCRTLANFENRVNILIGSEFSKIRELQGQWTLFLEAGPRYKNLEESKKGLWTKNNKSVKQFQTAAMANSGSSFSVKISRSETPRVGETPASVPDNIKNFIIADNAAYTFPAENVTFALEFGAKSVGAFPVRPNSDWFSSGLYKQYKDGPFKAGVTSDYFFGANGVATPFLKQFTLVMDPYVKIISDKSFKDFVQNKKQITIAHMTFDLKKDSQIEIVADSTYDDVYTVTIKRSTPQPLLVAAVTASPLL